LSQCHNVTTHCISQGTKVERIINQLFEGHTVNFIRCLHVPCTSERKESFMDLQVGEGEDVCGKSDV
jgi:hypothetical protein